MINYTEYYQTMTAEEIAIITKHCLHKHDSHYSYRKAYFKTHPENNIEAFVFCLNSIDLFEKCLRFALSSNILLFSLHRI